MCSIDWELLAAVVAAIGTVGIAYSAFYQLGQTRKFNIQRDTIDKCLMYETNPLIATAVKKLKKGRKPLEPDIGDMTTENYSNAVEYEASVAVVLNYLDALAIGVEQGNFEEKIVKAHMRPIIDHLTECLIDSIPPGVSYKQDHFLTLLNLRDKWRRDDK
jgi:hypothetical protein